MPHGACSPVATTPATVHPHRCTRSIRPATTLRPTSARAGAEDGPAAAPPPDPSQAASSTSTDATAASTIVGVPLRRPVIARAFPCCTGARHPAAGRDRIVRVGRMPPTGARRPRAPTSSSRVAASRASHSPAPWPPGAGRLHLPPRGRDLRRRRRRCVPVGAAARGRAGRAARGRGPHPRLPPAARPRRVGRAAGPLARVVDGFSLAFDGGVFEGDYLRSWVRGRAGRPRRAHLRRPAPGRPRQQPAAQRALLPARDGQRRVAQALRAAAVGLPALRSRPGRAGGRRRGARVGVHPVLLRAGHAALPRWRGAARRRSRRWSTAECCPTSRSPSSTAPTARRRAGRRSASGCRCGRGARIQTTEVRGTVSLALSLVETMLEACDAQHIDDPCVQARSVFVDTGGVSPVDFGITDEQQEQLLLAGHEAAGGFLAGLGLAAATCAGAAGSRKDRSHDRSSSVRRLADRARPAGRGASRRVGRHRVTRRTRWPRSSCSCRRTSPALDRFA